MISAFKGVQTFYGNGTVYVTYGRRVQRFRNMNFDAHKASGKDSLDFFITSDVVVGFGKGCSRRDAIAALERISAEIRGGGFEPGEAS